MGDGVINGIKRRVQVANLNPLFKTNALSPRQGFQKVLHRGFIGKLALCVGDGVVKCIKRRVQVTNLNPHVHNPLATT